MACTAKRFSGKAEQIGLQQAAPELGVNSVRVWGDASYTYDALDNLTTSRLTAGPNTRSLTHTYDPATNLLKSVTNSGGSAYNYSFQYDDIGNVKQRGSQQFVFDLGNRLKSAPGKGTYAYDGLGHRVSVVGPDGVNRINVYSQGGQLLYVKASNAATGTKYIHLHNHVIAEATGGSVQYDHTDGLGSPVARTDGAGKVISRTRYEPYGATAGGEVPVIGYAGHVNVVDVGLVYMQQRYYDSVAGRFLSVDPVGTDVSSGGNFNRYIYAADNPYKYIDPDGREIVVVGSADFKRQVFKDLAIIRSGKNGAKLVEAAEKSKSEIVIGPSKDGKNYTTPDPHFFGNGSDAKIEYNPAKTTGGKDEKGNVSRPPYVGLAHELGHGVAIVQGKQSLDMGEGKPGTTPPSEIQSMKAENGVRADHNLSLRKNHYEK